MKIRIKKTKQIKEISAMGAPMGGGVGGSVEGHAGPMSRKKRRLEEDGPIAAIKVGAGRSLTSKDDEDTFEGQKERNAHNPNPNRAIDPQGKLLGEEDLDESMMTLLATATEPEAGSGHTPFDGESDVGDWDFDAVKKRRAQRTLNRAYYPEMSHEEMFAHINESSSFDDMDSIDREFFANADDSVQVDPLSGLNDAEAAKKALENKGYIVEEELGQGMWGTVYKGKNTFKQPCAIKIVTGAGADRELSNYQTISAARSSNDSIAKHFPNVMEAWSPRDGIAVIAMELLQPLNAAQATFIPDASYLAGKNWASSLAPASDRYTGVRDVSKRFTHYIQNEIEEVIQMFDDRVDSISLDYNYDLRGNLTPEKLEASKDNVSKESLLKILQIGEAAPKMSKQYFENRKSAMTRLLGLASDAVLFMEILEEEAPNALGANAALAEIAFRIMLIGKMADVTKQEIDEQIRLFALEFLEYARQFTQIPVGYSSSSVNVSPKSHERRFLTAKGLHSAIGALYNQTGLVAKDLHDGNVMSRPNGDVVIVDVGLFKLNPKWSPKNNLQEMLRIRKKMLRNLRR